MTEKEKLEKVRAEIERRKKLHEKSLINPIQEGFGLQNVIKAKISELTYLHSFIDSMQEECNITGIKSKHATGKLKECIDNQTEEGLEKARKQLEEEPKECMYSKDNYTDKDRKVLCEDCEEECEFNKKEESVSEDLEEAARNIRDRLYLEEGKRDEFGNPYFLQNTILKAVIMGAQWQKEQMMAKAIDIEVKVDAGGYPYIPQIELYDYDKDIPLAKVDDKYKVVLIKED